MEMITTDEAKRRRCYLPLLFFSLFLHFLGSPVWLCVLPSLRRANLYCKYLHLTSPSATT